MTQQSKDELLACIMQAVTENNARWFDRLFAFLMSERLHADESLTLPLVKEVFAETGRARTTVLVVRYYQLLRKKLITSLVLTTGCRVRRRMKLHL